MEKAYLTYEDIQSIKYYWQDRRDLERWVDWKEKLPEIQRRFPDLIKIWEEHKSVERLLDLIVKNLEEIDLE